MNGQPVRVVKVGGSLLVFEGLPTALHDWLVGQPPAATVLLAGGGDLADVIRRADQQFRIGVTRAHWMCIELMSVSAKLLAALLPATRLIQDWPGLLDALGEGGSEPLVFDAQSFLRDMEPRLPGSPLPHSWAVTSDSISARLAEALNATELVLLKSADPPEEGGVARASETRYVDEHFPVAAGQLQAIRCVNLRSAESRETKLR